MPISIAPVLGAAKKSSQIAAGALGASKGTAPVEEGATAPKEESEESGEEGVGKFLADLLGLPKFDPEAAKAALIQGGVITALVVMFLIGLAMFVGRSVKIR